MKIKSTIFTAILGLFLISAMACAGAKKIAGSELPSQVRSAFSKSFPTASAIKWTTKKGKTGEYYYIAKWKQRGTEKEAHIQQDGTVYEVEK